MKTWEQAEFEAQQEAIKKWALKKEYKILNSWWMKRKIRKLRKLQAIITGEYPYEITIESYREQEVSGDGCNKRHG